VFLAAGSGGSGVSVLILIVVLGGGYLLFIRSIQRKQRNQAADQQNMRAALTVGTEIVTIGGLFGTVVDVEDDAVTLEISDGVTARYDRNAIARVITPADAEEDSADEDDVDDHDVDEDDADENDADAHLVDNNERIDGTDLDVTANSIIEKKD
jgi:preprotein translocase subunit YajC